MVTGMVAALRLGVWPFDTGVGRGWPGGQLLSLLVQRKLTKENTPCFAALRVPNFSNTVRAAAQLGLRPQTVLADNSRTVLEKLAAQTGEEKQPIKQSSRPPLRSQSLNQRFVFSPPQPEPRVPGLAGEAEGRRKLFERSDNKARCALLRRRLISAVADVKRRSRGRSQFFRRPGKYGSLGVSTDVGSAFFAYFLCTSKESKAHAGRPRPTPIRKINHRRSGAMPFGYCALHGLPDAASQRRSASPTRRGQTQ